MANPDVVKEYEQNLECKLTPDELKERVAELCSCCRDEASIEEERAHAAVEFGKQLKSLRKLRTALVTVLESGTEMRDVACVDVRDDQNNAVRTVRMDTMDIVEVRAQTKEEMQGTLPLSATQTPDAEEKELPF